MPESMMEILRADAPIGTQIVLWLTNGKEYSGFLHDIQETFVVIYAGERKVAINGTLIGGWEIGGTAEGAPIGINGTDGAQQVETSESTQPDLALTEEGAAALSSNELAAQVDPGDSVLAIRIAEIKARYELATQQLTLPLQELDFHKPLAVEGLTVAEEIKYRRELDRASNQYKHAVRIRELSRLIDTASIIRNLVTETKISRGIRLLAGQVLLAGGYHSSARSLFEEEWRINQSTEAAYYAAASSIEMKDLVSACWYLTQYHIRSGAFREGPAWFALVGLICRFKAYSQWARLLAAFEHSAVTRESMACFAEGLAYSMIGADYYEAAAGLVRAAMNGGLADGEIKSAVGTFPGEGGAGADPIWLQFLQEQETRSKEFTEKRREEELLARKRQLQSQLHLAPNGTVYFFRAGRRFGFVKDLNGVERWFREHDVTDERLLDDLYSQPFGTSLNVTFDTYEFQGRPRARNLRYPKTVESVLKESKAFASRANYGAACAAIKLILTAIPDHQEANFLFTKWKEEWTPRRKQLEGLPQGQGLYQQAQRAQLADKDLKRAEELFRKAIDSKDNYESSIKGLAMLLDQSGRRDESIRLLEDNLHSLVNKRPALNILETLYRNAGRYPEAIKILEQVKTLSSASETPAVLKRIAFNYYKSKKYDEAERVLEQVLKIAPLDETAAHLKSTLEEARESGIYTEADELFDPGLFTEVSYESLSPTLKFALERCDFAGVVDTVLATRNFTIQTVDSVNSLLNRVNRGRPRERARYLLTVARLMQEIGSEDYRRLRSTLFAYACAMGDSAASQHKPMDVVRGYYAEALFLEEHWDAIVNRVVQYMRSFVVGSEELLPIDGRSAPPDETIELISSQQLIPPAFWDGILDICLINRMTAKYLLARLEQHTRVRGLSLDFLRSIGVTVPDRCSREEYSRAWDDARRRRAQEYNEWFGTLRALTSNELSAASCQTTAQVLETCRKSWLPSIDQQRLVRTAILVKAARRLFMQIDFEERERTYQSCIAQVDSLTQDIEDNPIRFATGGIYPFLDWIRAQLTKAFEEVLFNTTPRVAIDIPIEQVYPDNSGRARLQIRVTNEPSCQPISGISLRLLSERSECWPAKNSFEYPDVIRGADSGVVECEVLLTESAVESRAVSVGVALSYSNRKGEQVSSPPYSVSLRLYPASEFVPLAPNPFAPYADGGPVKDPNMFFGRESDIRNIADAIINSDSKCVIIYGQKRAGKSSVLHHLRERLNASSEVLSVQLSLGTIVAKASLEALLYHMSQRLCDTLQELRNKGTDCPELACPPFNEFRDNALIVFLDFLRAYHQAANGHAQWSTRQLVFLIDEFTYLYTAIRTGKVPPEFMKTWKALLEGGNFSAVLVGQDVMPRFKNEFSNEFGVTQDLRLTYLPSSEAAKLLENPIRIGGPDGESRYRSKSLQRVLELTSGSAYYAQMFGNRLVNYMNDAKATYITEADVDRVAANMVRGADSLDKDKFDNMITAGDAVVNEFSEEEIIATLAAIARASRAGLCSRHVLVEENLENLDAILKDLKDRDVIDSPLQDQYKIHVGLFQEWLLSHFGRGESL